MRIDWSKTAKEVYNFVRGMSPYPCAFTNINIGNVEKGLKIYSGKYEIKEHNRPFGEMDISKNEFKIYVKDGLAERTVIRIELPDKTIVITANYTNIIIQVKSLNDKDNPGERIKVVEAGNHQEVLDFINELY